MTLRYVLDTNALSEPIKPEPNPRFMHRLERYRDQACTVAPAWHELVYGCRRLPPSKRRRELERYLNEILAPSLMILPYDAAAAAWHAEERARLGRRGKTPPFIDGQIAAIAKTQGLVLVSRNVTDFADFDDLVVEDWTRANRS